MIVTTDFLSINCSIRCISELFLLIGFCLFVYIFVVTAVSIVCIALVDLDPNSKMSLTFAYPHVKSNICIQGDLCMKTSSLIKSRTHCLTMCAVVNVDYQVGSHRTPLDRMKIKKHTFLLFLNCLAQ